MLYGLWLLYIWAQHQGLTADILPDCCYMYVPGKSQGRHDTGRSLLVLKAWQTLISQLLPVTWVPPQQINECELISTYFLSGLANVTQKCWCFCPTLVWPQQDVAGSRAVPFTLGNRDWQGDNRPAQTAALGTVRATCYRELRDSNVYTHLMCGHSEAQRHRYMDSSWASGTTSLS